MSGEKIKGIEIPQDNGDKKLSEQERMAWIRFSAQELSDDVLRSLRININGVSKYIKDVVYYNSDLEAIMNNPEELIKLQAFLKKKTGSDVELTGVYDKKTEIAVNEYRKNRNIEGEMAFFQKQNPAFAGLVQKYPTRFEEIKKRASIYNELLKMKGEVSYLAKDKEGKNITTVQQALTSSLDNANIFNSSTVSTYIEGWNGPGSINYVWFGSHDVTYTEYIRRLLNKNGVITELFGKAQKSQEQTLEKSQKEQLLRAKTFMDSLIARNPSLNMDNKKEVDTIYAMIIAGDIRVIDVLNKLTKKALKLTINLSTKEGLANALRAIGDTSTAGNIMHGELKTKLVDMTDTGDTSPEALTRFNNAYTTNHSKLSGDKKSQDIIQKKFNDILASISDDPTSEYYYLIGDTKKQQQMKDGLMALMVFDETMKQTGPEGLGDLAAIYNDMKGLNGLLTFSDENAKIGKEVGIMLASIALTAGLSSILSLAGGVLRVASVARVAKTVDSANKATRLTKFGTQIGNFARNGAGKGARFFELSAAGINRLRAIPIVGSTLVDGAGFTIINELLKSGFHSEGEMISDIEDYGRILAANTAMFGVFHGVGAITNKLVLSGKIKGAFAKFGTLSIGDVTGLYIIHLIDTGRYWPTKEEWLIIAAQAVGFRGAMKGIEKLYPKFAAGVKTYSEKQNIVAEGAGKQEMKAITADAGKSRTMDSKNVSNSNLESLKTEYEQIEKQIKIKKEARKQNYGTNTAEANKSSYNEIKELRRKGREIKTEIRKIEGVNKATEVEQNQKTSAKLEELQLEYEQIKKKMKLKAEQIKPNRIKAASLFNRPILKELKELGIERRRIRSEIKKLTPNEKTYTGRMEAIDSVVKTEKDLKINEYRKEIEKVDKELVRLNSEKITIESDLSNTKNQYEKLRNKDPKRAEKLKGVLEERTKLNQERLEQIEVSIKEQEGKLKDLNGKINQLKSEKKVLIDEKNKVASGEEQIEIKAIEGNKSKLPVVIQEVSGKTRMERAREWLKNNKKALIGTILAVGGAGGIGGVTYYILQKDSLGDTIPVIYIPKDDEDENNNQEGDDGESSEGQEGKQDGSVEGNPQGTTPVAPVRPSEGGQSYSGSNQKPAGKPNKTEKSGNQSTGTTKGDPTNIEGGQNAGNLQEQIKTKQTNLLDNLQNIYKNRYQDLKDIGLGDAFFGLDKGVELDENPIYLDYDGTINGRIIVNSKGEYQITLDNKKAIAGYKTNAVITGVDLFETLKKGYTVGREIDKAEVKAYHEAREKEEEKRRMYGA